MANEDRIDGTVVLVEMGMASVSGYRTHHRAQGHLYLWNMNYLDFIEIQSDKRFGRPCIKGTRISVYDVLNWMSHGMSKKDIIEDFTELTEEMINACLAFAADKEHRMRFAS